MIDVEFLGLLLARIGAEFVVHRLVRAQETQASDYEWCASARDPLRFRDNPVGSREE